MRMSSEIGVELGGTNHRHVTRRVARVGAAGDGMIGLAGVLLVLANSDLPFPE